MYSLGFMNSLQNINPASALDSAIPNCRKRARNMDKKSSIGFNACKFFPKFSRTPF